MDSFNKLPFRHVLNVPEGDETMRNSLFSLPILEVTHILGLAVALIAKPQTRVLSAAPEPTQIEKALTGKLLPATVAAQQHAGL